MTDQKPTILIIFGISGDLAQRYLLPAIKQIGKAKMLPSKFEIVGITRQKNSKFFRMDLTDKKDYERLNEYLIKIEKKFGVPTQRLFYLSVPPEACRQIVESIGKSSLKIKERNGLPSKILLEKPFGSDLKSAKELVGHVSRYFDDEHIYRIDHYMAKEAAQNLIVFRDSNSLFKRTWNSDFIESIEIVVSEKLGIEGRANFYEQTGALRDVVQSHLLQLAALVLMELPHKPEDVPILREKALKNLNIVCDITKNECVKRAQYDSYRAEVGNPKSTTETFVSINLQSSDPAWKGVPVILTAGKALRERLTVIKVRFRRDEENRENQSNELLIRIQPNPGIEFGIWIKTPGFEHKASEQVLDFLFNENYKKLPEAYEQVLFNAVNSDHSFFTSSREILETWRILDSIQKVWKISDNDLTFYKRGSSIEEVMS